MNFKLFIAFFKIGLFTFGGGYAMIPLIEKEIIEENEWISREELVEIIAISQMTPGPIATNAATFVGKKVGGYPGAFIATLGVVAPSLVIITTIFMFFSQSFENIYIQKIFTGLRAGIAGMIFISVKKLAKTTLKDKESFAIFIFSLLALIFSFISPIALIAIFGLGFMSLYFFRRVK
ncbi:MAG: chromate transporter [Fusobacteriaceae bacterium]